ncbi:hypothetical protein N2152v2_011140 [Parachlorella kessleri]
MAITAMPMLSRLDVVLPTQAFAVMDRVLPRSLHLTSLTVLFRDGDDEKFRFIEELTITRIPIDAELGFDLMKAARCLSRGLTSLDLSFCSPDVGHNPAAAALQGDSLHQLDQLASLMRLERLHLNGLLGGQQRVPTALSTLTSLRLQGHNPMVLRGIGSLLLLCELRLQDLSEWPSGLESLQRLTHLALKAGRTLDLPAGCALPPQLRHLEVSADPEADTCAIVLPSLSNLGQLQHLNLKECDLDELLDSLPHLSCLTLLRLRFCSLEEDLGVEGGRLQLSHLAALQHLQVESCTLSEAPAGLRQLSALTELVLAGNDIGVCYCSDESDDDSAMGGGCRPVPAGLLGAMYDGRMTRPNLDEDDRIWLGPPSPVATLSRLPALHRLSIRQRLPHWGLCHHRSGSKSARRLVQQQLHSFLLMPSPTLSVLTYLQLYDSASNLQLPWSGLSACLARMPSLRHLEIVQPCSCCWPKGIGQLQHLTHLSLVCDSNAPACAQSPFPLAPPRLQALQLGCEVGSKATSRKPLPLSDKLWTVCPQLSHLTCYFVDGPALVRAMPALTGLTELSLQHCDLSGAPLDLRHMRSLQCARFPGCRISQPPIGLSTLGALTKLELYNNTLDYSSARVVRDQAGSHVNVKFT